MQRNVQKEIESATNEETNFDSRAPNNSGGWTL